MTKADKERERYRLMCMAEEGIKSLQSGAMQLKNVEDIAKNTITVMKMQDSIADIRRAYADIDRLDNEPIDEE